MSARSVIVDLRLQAAQYIREARRAADETRRLRDEQARLNKSGQEAGGGLMGAAKGLAALGAAGLAVKALPGTLAAAGTGAAALPGILGAAAADAVVLKVGMHGVAQGIAAVSKESSKDPFHKLSGNARAFVAEVGAAQTTLKGYQQGLQQRLFAGAAADMNALVTKTLPSVSSGLGNIATDFSHLFREVTAATLDPQVKGAFNVVTASAHRFLGQVVQDVQPAAGALASLTLAADPVVRAIGDHMTGAVAKLSAKVTELAQSGALEDFFDSGAKTAEEMFSYGQSVVRIFGEVVSEVEHTSTTFKNGSAALKEYLDSGRGADDIAGTVHLLDVAAEGLLSTIGPLATALRDTLSDPGTANGVKILFDAMTLGARTVNELLAAFSALPDGLQGGILAAIGVGVALVKMSALMGKAEVAIGKFATRLAATGPAGTIASRGLTKVAGAASKALGVLVALQAIGAIFGRDVEIDTSALAKSLIQFSKDGTVAGETANAFGDNMEDLQSALKTVADTGAWSDFEYGFRGMADTLGVGGVFNIGVKNSEDRISALDAALADLVGSGHAGEAEQAFARIAAAAGTQGISVTELEQVMPGYQAALAEIGTKGMTAAQSAADAAERTRLLGGSFQDAALAGKDLAATLDILNGKNIGVFQSQIALEAAYDAADQAVSKYGRATKKGTHEINLTTEAGRAQLTALIAVADQAKAAAQAQEDQSGNTAKSIPILEAARKKIIDLGAKTLGSRDAATKLADQILKIPDKEIKIGAKTGEAIASIESLGFKVTGLPDGTFKITAKTDKAKANMVEANRILQTINGRVAATKIETDATSVDGAKAKVTRLADDLRGMPEGLASMTVTGADTAQDEIAGVRRELTGMPEGIAVVRAQTAGARKQVAAVRGDLRGLPDGLAVVKVDTKDKRKVDAVTAELQSMPDGLASIRVNNNSALSAIRQVRQSLANLGGASIPVSANRDGGVYKRAAADGLVDARIAPPGTLYQWAEPETGGEAFVPRRGDKRRGRAIVAEAAEWYGMRVVPMAGGGIMAKAAATGLVNVAPKATATAPERATRLDFAESYTQARDAVAGLNKSLKDNGRSFSLATAKGRENRSSLYSVIRAAQDAAQTKFKETGSVRLANKAYDEHIARLRHTLQQQKINSATIRGLLTLAQRPVYDTGAVTPAAPKNSSLLVAAVRSQMAAAGGISDLRDALSLNKPTTGLGTAEGRANLGGILDFLGQAEAAAQDRYAQSGSSKLATALYNGYIAQLRSALSSSGYSKAAISSLINAYGRITLSKNAQGGVHFAAAGAMSLGAGAAGVYPSSRTLYGFAEPGTGGEAFIPRNGNRERGRELVDIAAGWYGGRFAQGGRAGGGGSTTITNNMTITPLSYNPTTTELLSYQRQLDAQARVGRRR